MTIFLVIVAALAVLAAIYAVAVKGDYEVVESEVINVPRDKVFSTVADLRGWKNWSPWLLHEPDCPLSYSENPAPDTEGGWYEWKGNKIGAGRMTHLTLASPGSIEQRLEFQKPFKSTCKVGWNFEEADGGTKVTWSMSGKMPFLFKLMKNMVKSSVSSDYKLGLKMLNSHLDPKAEKFNIEFHGTTEYPATRCAFHNYSGSMEGLKKHLPEIFPKVMDAAKDKDGKTPGLPMGVCNKMDRKTGHIDYDAAVPTAKESCGDFAIKEYPAATCNKVVLTGSYELLPLVWNAAFANTYMNKLRPDKGKVPFEVYENDPNSVAPEELTTAVYIPVKG